MQIVLSSTDVPLLRDELFEDDNGPGFDSISFANDTVLTSGWK